MAIDLRLRERAVLVTVCFRRLPHRDPWPVEEIAAELRELVRSTGVQILKELLVVRDLPTPGLLIGRGRAEELQTVAAETGADVVIFNRDLSSAQQRDLEEITRVKVIDRTQLILDLFAQRAHSQEGKVQVELAQHEYLLPRLGGKGILLSRLGGGIGTRGPGEQKLEVDRRRIRMRIAKLQRDLGLVRQRRATVRRERQTHATPTVALVGYTNAGKTTLFNILTKAQAPVEDQLFTTLDPMARRLILPTHQTIVLSDTVGFLHQLPHRLIEAFQATLEEVREAQLLIHVVDAASPLRDRLIEAVLGVLEELEAVDKPRLLVFNKLDRLEDDTRRSLLRLNPEAVLISALTGEGLAELCNRIAHQLSSFLQPVSVEIPQTAQAWVHRVYEEGRVVHRRDVDGAIQLEAFVPPPLKGQLQKAGFLP